MGDYPTRLGLAIGVGEGDAYIHGRGIIIELFITMMRCGIIRGIYPG